MNAPLASVSTTNACKLCTPMGASIAFRGIAGCVPFLHGSQGCATYMRRYIISHYNEPIDIASSSLGEKHAVYGGAANLKQGLRNVCETYHPRLVGIATTCLTETIGDNVPMILQEYRAEFGSPDMPTLVQVATPSYAGSHMEGFHGAVKAVVDHVTVESPTHDRINLLPGFVSPADIRYLRTVCADFGMETTILPDYSDTLDGPALNEYQLIPDGGTPLWAIRSMGGAPATIELGATLTGETAGSLLHTRFSTPLHRLGLPIGIRASDVFFATLSRISSRPIPERHQAARGRLVDALVDGHKYLVGKRAVIYGEEDLVVGMTSFLAELGIHPVLCASGGKSGRLKNAVMEALARIDVEPPVVLDDADFHDIEAGARAAGADLLVGHSKGYSFARRVGIPLIRVGFPIHDRVGGQRILHLGYDGAQALFDLIANSLIEKKQNDSPVGYSYM